MEKSLLATLDIQSAIGREAAAPPFLLPSRHIEEALGGALAVLVTPQTDPPIERLVGYCRGRYRRSQERYPVEVVSTSKSPKGHRPIHVLSFEQRVLYRALVESLSESPIRVDRSDDAWSSFQQGPLQDESYRYIIRTDVVGCYTYINHSRLLDELVARTGNAEAAEELVTFLGVVTGGQGLPQNLGPSHVLAEFYLDAVERALLRRGHPTWRFSDDFIIASSSWPRINAALSDLSAQLLKVGLVINEEKTRFFKQDTYRQWIEDPLTRLQAAGGDAILAAVEEYDPNEPPDDEGRQLDLQGSDSAALELLDRCLQMHKSGEPTDRLDVTVNRKVARGALRLLSITGSLSGLQFVPDLLRFEPQLTPSVAIYLTRASLRDQQEAVRAVVSEIATDADLYLSPWQTTWLIQPLLRTGDEFDAGIFSWLRSTLLNPLSLARARAAEALAWPDQIEPVEITQLYAAAPPATQANFAAAVALRCWDSDARPVRSIKNESPFNALVINSLLAD